jgi:uncharacterized protein
VNEPIKAVIDTQLFLRAAINRKSLPAKIIFDRREAYQLVVSPAIVAEIKDVLNRPKLRTKFPSLADHIVDEILELLEAAESVNPSDVPPVSRDPKDDIFLACAQASKAVYLVSEDNDLLTLDPYENIRIINALDFLAVVSESSSE